MTTTTMHAMRERMDQVGNIGLLSGEGMEFPVRVLDTKVVYGVQRFLVEPVGGKGQKWADAVRVRPMPAQGQAEAKEEAKAPEASWEFLHGQTLDPRDPRVQGRASVCTLVRTGRPANPAGIHGLVRLEHWSRGFRDAGSMLRWQGREEWAIQYDFTTGGRGGSTHLTLESAKERFAMVTAPETAGA